VTPPRYIYFFSSSILEKSKEIIWHMNISYINIGEVKGLENANLSFFSQKNSNKLSHEKKKRSNVA
jgi:hypothetical protein